MTDKHNEELKALLARHSDVQAQQQSVTDRSKEQSEQKAAEWRKTVEEKILPQLREYQQILEDNGWGMHIEPFVGKELTVHVERSGQVGGRLQFQLLRDGIQMTKTAPYSSSGPKTFGRAELGAGKVKEELNTLVKGLMGQPSP